MTIDALDDLISGSAPTNRHVVESAQPSALPLGQVGADADAGRDHRGRFAHGNCAALVTGQHSAQFWQAVDTKRREIRDEVLKDAGETPTTAPRVLLALADGIAQCILVRDSAFDSMVALGGPLTVEGRARRASKVWQTTHDAVASDARILGLKRVPKSVDDLHEYLRGHASPADTGGETTRETTMAADAIASVTGPVPPHGE
jgi:hypothetical protein